MNALALITAILQAAPEELALVEALIGIAKGTHRVVPVTPPALPAPVQNQVVGTPALSQQIVTTAPAQAETVAPVIPPNGVKETLK